MRRRHSGRVEEQERKEWAARLEKSLKANDSVYFDLDTYEDLIEYYLENNQIDTAFNVCQLALGQYPFSNEIKIKQALVYVAQNNLDAANDLIVFLEPFCSSEFEYVLLKTNYLMRQGNQPAALGLLFKAIDWFKDDQSYIGYLIGINYMSLEKYSQAVRYFKICLKDEPDNEEAHYELAICYELLEQDEQSLKCYLAILNTNPFHAEAWCNLGVIYSKKGDYDNALEAYEYAMAADPSYVDAYFNQGNLYMNEEEYNLALSAYSSAAELEDDNAEVFICIGACHEQLKDYRKAISFYKKALVIEHQNDQALYGIGSCLFQNDKFFEAIHYFKRAFQIVALPEYAHALARAEYEIGNTHSAGELYEQAAGLDPENPDIWLEWANIYYESGHFDRALDILEQAQEYNPESATLFYRCAAFALSAGKARQGILYLQTALELDFDAHGQLFEYLPNPNAAAPLLKIIDQYRQIKP